MKILLFDSNQMFNFILPPRWHGSANPRFFSVLISRVPRIRRERTESDYYKYLHTLISQREARNSNRDQDRCDYTLDSGDREYCTYRPLQGRLR